MAAAVEAVVEAEAVIKTMPESARKTLGRLDENDYETSNSIPCANGNSLE